MSYNKEELEKIDLEIEKMISSGKYKQLGFEVIDSIKSIKLEENTMKLFKRVLTTYFEYLDMIDNLDIELKTKFLSSVKVDNNIDNNNVFLNQFYFNIQNKNIIDEILNIDNLNEDNLKNTHKLLMGTNNNVFINIGEYRKNNRKYVGEIYDGKRIIQYFPLDYKKIPTLISRTLNIYNNNSEENLNNIFIKPFIIHALMLAYQVFDDGNARMARLMQNKKIYELTRKYTKYKIAMPAVYLTKIYYPYKKEYRDLINNLVNNPNSDNWNNWFIFNLKRLEDELYKNINNLEAIITYEKNRKI